MPDNDFNLIVINRLDAIQRSVDDLRDNHALAATEQAQLKAEWNTTKRVLGWLVGTAIALMTALAAYANEIQHTAHTIIK